MTDDEEKIIIKVSDLRYRHDGGTPGLDGASFSVRPGERLAIVGANGSGKSTLLRLLDGIIFPTEGDIHIHGRPLTEESLRDLAFARWFRTHVGFLFQVPDHQLFCPTVEEDLAFGPRQIGVSEDDVAERVEGLLEFLRLEPLRERPPYALSLGERKKVALAAVLAVNPDLLLLDEPTAGLDPRTTDDLVGLLLHLHREGKTIITATLDLHLLPEIADRVIILGPERTIVGEGTVEELLDDPDRLKRWNLLHTHLHRHGDRWHRHPHGHDPGEGNVE